MPYDLHVPLLTAAAKALGGASKFFKRINQVDRAVAIPKSGTAIPMLQLQKLKTCISEGDYGKSKSGEEIVVEDILDDVKLNLNLKSAGKCFFFHVSVVFVVQDGDNEETLVYDVSFCSSTGLLEVHLIS